MNEENILEANDLESIKAVLKWLVTEEKIRQEEIAALKEMITSVDGYAKDYVDGQNFNAFKEEFGEKLEPYNEAFKATEGEDFDMTKSAYDSYKELEDDSVSQSDFVDAIVEEADKYIDNLKNALGLPADTAVSIESDENGDVTVTADKDGDGEPETVVADESTETENVESEEPATEEEKTDEEIQAEIDEAVDNYNPRR